MEPEARRGRRREGAGATRPPFSGLSTLLEELARTPDVQVGSDWDAVLRPGAMVGRFELVREIGRGGFGVVWEALDTHLGRSIAFKALRVRAHAGLNQERMLREVDVAARLAHPNVVTLHDCGRTEHGPYVVLELLRGETLASRLARGPVEVPEALRVAIEAARGVAHAHAHGVVHRDLQPSNVFLCQDGQVKILDFGLAHAFGTPRVRGGTPDYMAPEQWRGAPEDERTDVFALGVILYRMLTGNLPFQGTSQTAGQGAERAPAVRVDGVPAVGDLVGRMLENDPVLRPRDAGAVVAELTAAQRALDRAAPDPTVREERVVSRQDAGPGRPLLRRPAVAIALGILVALAAIVAVPALRDRRAQGVHTALLPAEKRLAVLPFREVNASPGQEALGAGLTEMLTSKLRQLEQFRTSLGVVSAGEVVREGVTSAKEARNAFGATLALSGSIQWSGNRVAITADLVDASTSLILAARDVQAPRDDVAALQRNLVAAVVEMLQVQLEPEAVQRLLADPSPAPGAYEFYLQGRGYLQRYDRLENLDSAAAVFDQALARDPAYALAHAGKAETFLRRYELTQDTAFLDSARASAARALELGDRLAAVQFTVGLVEVAGGDHAAAIHRFDKALELEPDDADAQREMANAYDGAGRIAEAEATFRRAIHARPSSWAAYKDLGVFYSRHGRLTEALPMLQRVVELTPDNYAGYANLGGLYFLLGLHEDAVRTLEKSLSLRATWHAWSNLGSVHFYQHRYAQAADAFRHAVELTPADSRQWGNLGDAERWSGRDADAARDYRRAIALLEKQLALQPRSSELWSRIAMHLSALGEHERALAHAAKALRLDPKDGLVLFRSALVHEEAGQRDRALDAVRAALLNGFSREEVRTAPPLAPLREDPRFERLVNDALAQRRNPRKEGSMARTTRKPTKAIHIRVDGEDITVTPTAAHVDSGDAIEWHIDGEDGALLLTFTDGEAVGATKLRANPGQSAKARAAKRGVFHYQVAIYTGGQIHADVGCPTIIIR